MSATMTPAKSMPQLPPISPLWSEIKFPSTPIWQNKIYIEDLAAREPGK